jgi:hypothetical protein
MTESLIGDIKATLSVDIAPWSRGLTQAPAWVTTPPREQCAVQVACRTIVSSALDEGLTARSLLVVV